MGVEVHANIIDNLLHSEEQGRGFLKRGFNEMTVIPASSSCSGWFSDSCSAASRRSIPRSPFCVALAAFGWFVYFSFAQKGQWLSFVIPAGTLAANYAAITSLRMIREERDKRKIRKSFSQYLSPGVIELIEKDPEKYIRPGGEMKELSVLFSDIRGFTTISEGLTPDELVQLLNEYFGQMTEIVFATDGTLDKYIGDAIMAFWGSPYPQEDHALRSCTCALRMVARPGDTECQMASGRPAADRHRHRTEHRPGERRQHGFGEAPVMDRDGRQREPGVAPGRHHQGISHADRDQRSALTGKCPASSSAASSTKFK